MICTVVGTRPNFIKMAPIIDEINRRDLAQVFVHTGKHYDEKMSDIFFTQLGMPHPDVYLGVGSGSHATQTAKIMMAFEAVCLEHQPDLVIVPGDVNSTVACALVAAKLNIPVAHVESGLRSFDREMPEEINRIVTDHVADLLFTTEPSGNQNLANEGIDAAKIHYVGNSMIDSLETHLPRALESKTWEQFDLTPGGYGVVTLHRPSNVDRLEVARELASALDEIGADVPLLFPIHPRTLSRGDGLWESLANVRIIDPLGYLEFLGLMAKAKVVITDSGGIQEETTALGVSCLTVRRNTERPVTLTVGTNRLVDPTKADLLNAYGELGTTTDGQRPDLWDGKVAGRLVDVVQQFTGA